MALRFFFEYDNRLIQLPVNPAELRIKAAGANSTIEVLKTGEINLLKSPKLMQITVESFLPKKGNAPYVLTEGEFKKPQFYINFFNKVKDASKPMRFIVSDTKVNMLVSIESFEHWIEAQDDDTHFSLDLKEYKPHEVKELKLSQDNKVVKKSQDAEERPKTGFSIGDTIIANGKYFYDSYGSSPFGVFKNFEGKISHIVADTTRPYRYHITTPSGGYRGWLAANQLTHK